MTDHDGMALFPGQKEMRTSTGTSMTRRGVAFPVKSVEGEDRSNPVQGYHGLGCDAISRRQGCSVLCWRLGCFLPEKASLCPAANSFVKRPKAGGSSHLFRRALGRGRRWSDPFNCRGALAACSTSARTVALTLNFEVRKPIAQLDPPSFLRPAAGWLRRSPTHHEQGQRPQRRPRAENPATSTAPADAGRTWKTAPVTAGGTFGLRTAAETLPSENLRSAPRPPDG